MAGVKQQEFDMTIAETPPVFRFAPSPNGALHLGHAYSAILNHEAARSTGGKFLVRIEDIDQSRCSASLERAMLDDLAWLGLEWDEPVRRQSEHFDDYVQALETLEDAGMIYRSYLTRGDIRRIVEFEERGGKVWPRDPDDAPLVPGREFEPQPDADVGYALRLDINNALAHVTGETFWQEGRTPDFALVERQSTSVSQWGNVVLARRDTPTSYHLSVVVDDAIQGITHVVRGMDLKQATGVHILLQQLLGLPHPVYHHHELILDNDGRKLSKSRQDTSLASLRAAGATREDVLRLVGLTQGLITETAQQGLHNRENRQ